MKLPQPEGDIPSIVKRLDCQVWPYLKDELTQTTSLLMAQLCTPDAPLENDGLTNVKNGILL